MLIREVALDLTNFVLSNVNDAISFKPQLCYQVPAQDYVELRERYIAFTGTSMRKNKSKLYFLPTNISDELQQLNPSIPDSAKRVARDGHVYYKNRLITELDYENVKRVELACAYIAYATVNKAACVEVTEHDDRSGSNCSSSAGYDQPETDPDVESEKLSPAESTALALRRGGVIGFRELGYLVAITPWHFHRVFKVITGLTIREYGQLCTEFVKKNRDIMSACKRKIEDLKSQGHSYHCFDEPNFLKDGSLCYEPTTNVVLLPEYFIDPNKSKEHKKKQKEAKTSDGKCTQRVEARKRRSSVMSGRIRRASQTSISSNTSIQEALHGGEVSYPSTPQLSPTDHGGNSSGHSVSASPVLGGYNAIDFSAPNMETSLSRSQFSGRSRKGSLVTNLLSSAPAGVAVSGKILKPKAVPHGSNGNNNYMRHMSEPSLAITARGLEKLPLDTGSKVPVGGVTTVTDATNVSAQTALSPQIDFKFDIFGTHGSAKGLNNTSVTTANDILDGEDPYSTVTSTGITEGSCLKNSEAELQGSENSRGFHLGENTSSSLNSSDKKAYSLATPAANSSSGETYVQTHSRHHGSPRNNEFEAESEANMLLDLNAVPDEVMLTESYSVFEPKFDNLHSGDSFTSIPDYAISSMSGEHQISSSSQIQQVPSQFLQQQHQQQQQRLQQQQQLELQEERQQHQEQQQQQQDTLQNLSNSFDAYARNRMNSVAPEMDELDRMFLSGYDGSSAFDPHFSADDGDNLASTINFASQPSTRDNTMGTATTTDTSASTRNFVDKNDMAAYTNLGFGTLSPCASPTAVDFEATLSTNQPSIEALISSGHDDIIGNQLGFTSQVTNQ